MNQEETNSYVQGLLAANPALTAEDSLDWKIRQALEFIIKALDNTVIVYPFDTLSLNPLEWANLFRNLNIPSKQIHGWVIKRTDISAQEHRANMPKSTYFYDIWGFYGFNADTLSDITFQKFIDLFCFVTNQPAMRKLGLDSIRKGVDEHQYLQFSKMQTLGKGLEQMHWSPARLEVRLCC